MAAGDKITISEFRAAMPALADPEIYPDETLRDCIDMGYIQLDYARYGELHPLVQRLYVAHFAVLEAQDMRQANAGRLPGQTSGMIASKSLGGASISYDIASTNEDGGGHWNTTIYGKRLLRLIRMAGMGGVQIS